MEQAQKLINLIILFFIGERDLNESVLIYNKIVKFYQEQKLDVSEYGEERIIADKLDGFIYEACSTFGVELSDFFKEMKVLNLEEIIINENV